MRNFKDERKSPSFNPAIKNFLNRIIPGQRLRLREGAYRHIREREWIFNRIEDNKIYLLHDSRAYGILVEAEDIDWGKYNMRFQEKDENNFNNYEFLRKEDNHGRGKKRSPTPELAGLCNNN